MVEENSVLTYIEIRNPGCRMMIIRSFNLIFQKGFAASYGGAPWTVRYFHTDILPVRYIHTDILSVRYIRTDILSVHSFHKTFLFFAADEVVEACSSSESVSLSLFFLFM